MINCKDFMAEIGNYLDGEVADAVRLQLEAHLSHCQTCQVVYDSARKTVKVLTDSGSFELLTIMLFLISRVVEVDA